MDLHSYRLKGMQALKRKVEFAILGDNTQKKAGTSALRRMGSLSSYFTAHNVSLGKGGTIEGNGNGHSVIKAGEPRELTKDLFYDALFERWKNMRGCGTLLVIASPRHHGLLSRYLPRFHGKEYTFRLVSSRQAPDNVIYIIDPLYLQLVNFERPLARKLLDDVIIYCTVFSWKTTLEVLNPDAHYAIYAV